MAGSSPAMMTSLDDVSAPPAGAGAADLVLRLDPDFRAAAAVAGRPGARALAGEDRNPAVVAYLRQKYHFDEPLPARYLLWVGAVLDRRSRRVRSASSARCSISCSRNCRSPPSSPRSPFCSRVSLGVPLGILSAVKNGSLLDYAATMAALVGPVDPEFLVGDIADPAVLGRVGAVAGFRLRQPCREPVAQSRDPRSCRPSFSATRLPQA